MLEMHEIESNGEWLSDLVGQCWDPWWGNGYSTPPWYASLAIVGPGAGNEKHRSTIEPVSVKCTLRNV